MTGPLPQETYGTHPRRYAALSITSRCNSRCRHCSNWESTSVAPELPFGDFAKFLLDAYAVSPDFHVQITGGEPLLRAGDVVSIVKELSARGVHTHLATNGLLLDGDLPARLAGAGLSSLAVSLDGPGHHHDWLRGVPGAFEKAMRAIERMGEFTGRVRVSVATVLYDRMLTEAAGFTRHVLDIPFLSHVNFQAIFPDLVRHPKRRFADDQGLWPNDAKKAAGAIDAIIEIKNEGGRVKNPAGQLEAFKDYFADPQTLYTATCTADEEILHIAPNGDVRLCIYEETPIGNVQHTTYSGLIASPAWTGAVDALRRCRTNCHMVLNCCYVGG